MHTFIFDVDNTLTPPRQKILEQHFKVLNEFIALKKIYFVSGSDYAKLNWQLSPEILLSCAGVFTCLGNCFHIKNNIIYENKFKQLSDAKLRSDIQNFIINSKTPVKTSNHIEERTGMINISTVGRNASLDERILYHKFDKSNMERIKFVKFLNKKYPDLDVSIGGEISIDISVKNYNKSQILKHIPEKQNLIFFGDRCDTGGNDEPLAKEILKCNGVVYNVQNFYNTYEILNKLLELEKGN